MKRKLTTLHAVAVALLVALVPGQSYSADQVATTYAGWKHHGTITLLTTPDGANLPASATVEGFPVLVRLRKDWFDFSQAKANGDDLRFSTAGASPAPLPYQVDAWDAEAGTADIWVRVPTITGNTRQDLLLHWGKSDAVSESNGATVFNESNGYASVWHLNGPVTDAVGVLSAKDNGTTDTSGIIGKARHFAGDQGIFAGEKIEHFPTGPQPHSSEAWIRATATNGNILGWGNEKAQGKVVMQFASPPHINVDAYFSGGNATGKSTLPMAQWVHVVHTYNDGRARLYVNGVLDSDGSKGGAMAITKPARLWIGGWYNNYNFVGDIDEVRISLVARSADWVKAQYENQKPAQTLVGPLIQSGTAWSVTPTTATIPEGKNTTFTAQAGGAQQVTWTLISEGVERVLTSARFSCTVDAGRVVGNKTATLRCTAIYPNVVKTKDIPLTITEDIPEPIFTLKAPTTWDGRSTIEVLPQVTNLSAMQAKGAGDLRTDWQTADFAVTRASPPGKLVLTRSQNSGRLLVSATISNGGQAITQSATITVTEPKTDAWIARVPAKDEQPEDGQFYARDDTNAGTLYYKGTLTEPGDAVFLTVFAGDQVFKRETAKLGADRAYAFAVKLKPGLVTYRAEFGTTSGGIDQPLRTVSNLVCGDAYLIDGQSNAVSTDWGKGDFPETSEWIRSFGSTGNDPKSVRWGNAIRKAKGDRLAIGYWGFDVAKRLVETQQIPICIINGAVGGTRVDQHQRSLSDPQDLSTIYGRLLWRTTQAKLTHGIRGIFWHQGENDQGSDGPTGGFGWQTYRELFLAMAASWKQDYPNIQHYYLFQIWPSACSMGREGSDNRLREVQRRLPSAFAHMSIMSTLGIDPPGGCHYPPEGYAQLARLIAPLVEQYNYGKAPTASITPPDLKRVAYVGGMNDTLLLEFDQPVAWDDTLISQFYLDGMKGRVASGSVNGNVLTLKLTPGAIAQMISYLDSRSWSQKTLLRGTNGIAALTFYEVPIEPARATR
jgi:Concanavalin A-like lectin/glucanases superfamily/Domain of unknown function (DUF2341)/Carbohydrate esterase, sialic acid-specific acetylesterase